MEDYQEIEFVLREQDYQAEIQVRGLKGGSTPLFLVIFLAITITCFFSSHHMFFFLLVEGKPHPHSLHPAIYSQT